MNKIKCPSCNNYLNVDAVRVKTSPDFAKCTYCGSVFDVGRFAKSSDKISAVNGLEYEKLKSKRRFFLILLSYVVLFVLIACLFFVIVKSPLRIYSIHHTPEEHDKISVNSTKDPGRGDKRDESVFDINKFDKINEAIASIHGSMNIGVEYPKLAELIQKMSVELLVLKSKRNSKMEEVFISYYDDILEAFMDGLYIAERQLRIEEPSKSGALIARIELDPINDYEKYQRLYRNATKYKISISKRYSKTTKKEIFYINSYQVQNIWRYSERGYILLLNSMRKMEDSIRNQSN